MNTQIVVKALEKQASPITRKVTSLVINSQESFDQAGEMIKTLKEIDRKAVEEEKKITDPLTQALQAAKTHFKPFHDHVKLIEADTKAKMLTYVKTMEQKQLKALDDFDKGKIKKISTLTSKQEALQVVSSSAQTRQVWSMEVVDASIIPREYLMPDEAKIKEALKAGKKVKGCEWKQVKTIAI